MKTNRIASLIALAGLAGSATAQCPPPAPTGLGASRTWCTHIHLAWNPASGADEYYVWRSTTPNSQTALPIGVASATAFDDSLVGTETTYYYWVSSHHILCLPGQAQSQESNTASGWKAESPYAPVNVAASDGTVCGAVRVTWDQPSALGADVAQYTIWRNTVDLYLTSSQVGTAPGGDRSFIDINATPGTNYHYWVRAENSCGTAASSGALGYVPTSGSPPAGDDCGSALPVIAGGTYTGSTDCATPDGPSGCGYDQTRDVWFRFVAPAAGTLHADNCAAYSNFASSLSVFTNGCPATAATRLACAGPVCGSDGRKSSIDVPVPAGTYLIRLAGYSQTDFGNYELHVGFIPSGPPANDNCSSPTPVVAGGTYTGNNTNATPDGPGLCGYDNGRDVWFRFVAPGSGTLHADNCGGISDFYSTLSAYSDVCPATATTRLACAGGVCGSQSVIDLPVSAGAAYLIRLAGFSSADAGNYELHIGFTPSGPVCYPNCDNSTVLPVLNVLDFGCFLNKFAAGDSYANCDGSTTPPVLNVLDFGCFLNRFAAGCT